MLVSRARRFAAALFAALLLQAIALGSGAVCPAPGATGAAELAPASASTVDPHAAHHAATGSVMHDEAVAHEHAPGDHAPAHCVMAMTCTAAGLVASVVSAVDDEIVAAAMIAASNDDLPPSPGGAPEPPPPRV